MRLPKCQSNYFHSFEIFIIQIGAQYYAVAGHFEALVRKIDVPALVLQNHPKSIRTSVRTSISRTSASKWPATA
jgi:hypothetical protein